MVRAFSLFQLGQRFLKTSERNRNSDTRLLGLEDDEDGSLAVLQLLDQRILDHHLRVAGERVAAQKGRMPHILVVDLQSKSRRQQDAERRKHAQNARAVGGPLEAD